MTIYNFHILGSWFVLNPFILKQKSTSRNQQSRPSHFLFYYGFVPTLATSTNSNGSDVCESVYYHVQYDGVDVGMDVNQRDQGSNHLLSALASLGLPPTDDFALQGTAEAPFPEEWIWLLRIREIWNDCKKR